ncbi:MAG: glycosyltransferase family 39 protein [Patescibacteria group bacterium]
MNKIIERIFKRKHIEYYLLTLVLILGFTLRLYRIGNPIADWHSWRQADTASVSKTYLEKGINLLYPRYHDVSSIQTGIFNPQGYRFVEFPVFNALHALLAKNFPTVSFEMWGRLLSIFSALMSSIFIFLIAKRLMGKWVGILSAIFFLFLPYNIYFTRVILPEPLATTFALGSLWLFVKFLDSERIFHLILSGILFSVAILVKPFTFFFIAPFIYLAHTKFGIKNLYKDAKHLIGPLVFLNIAFGPFLLWRAWMSQYPVGIPFFTWAFNGDHIRFRPAFWRWIFGERLGHLILGGWGLIVFAFGILSRAKGTKFVLSLLTGMLLYVTTFATASVRHDYYQIFIIPAVSFTLALGTINLWKSEDLNKLFTRILLGFSLVVMFITSALQVKEFYKINRPEIIAAGRAIERLTPKDAWVIAPYNGDTAFLYQTGRWGWPAIDDSIDNIIKKGADYYVSVSLNDPDTKMIRERFSLVAETPTYVIFDLHKKR